MPLRRHRHGRRPPCFYRGRAIEELADRVGVLLILTDAVQDAGVVGEPVSFASVSRCTTWTDKVARSASRRMAAHGVASTSSDVSARSDSGLSAYPT